MRRGSYQFSDYLDYLAHAGRSYPTTGSPTIAIVKRPPQRSVEDTTRHDGFLQMLPTVRRHARFPLRHLMATRRRNRGNVTRYGCSEGCSGAVRARETPFGLHWSRSCRCDGRVLAIRPLDTSRGGVVRANVSIRRSISLPRGTRAVSTVGVRLLRAPGGSVLGHKTPFVWGARIAFGCILFAPSFHELMAVCLIR